MELSGYGKNLMSSNDSRHILKMINIINGQYKYADHYKKIIKIGYFLNNIILNGFGTIIDYNKNTIKITIGNFINDIPELFLTNSMLQKYTITYSHSPYHCYLNTIKSYDGSTTQKKEYYSHGILHEYISTESGIIENKKKDIFIQIFIYKINDFHNKKDFGNVVCDAKIIKQLPVNSHEMYDWYRSYISLNDLLTDDILC